MKKTILVLTSCAALTLGVSAAEAQKVATIDLRKVFDNYWRTKQADANLKEQAADLEKERQVMVDQFVKNEEKYKKLLDSANDQALSTTERDKRKKDAENELLNLRDMETRIKQFDNTSRATLGEKQRRIRDNILVDIRDTVKAKVKSIGYDLVIDTAAQGAMETPDGRAAAAGFPIVVFSSGANDLTEVVLKEINLNAPATPPAKTETKPEKGAK